MLAARYLQQARLSFKRSTFASRRRYNTQDAPAPKSAYSTLYSSIFPAMIPVFLLGSAVYLGLQLTQLKLAHEKHMEEAQQRVQILEAEIEALQNQRASERHVPKQGVISANASSTLPKEPTQRRWW